MTNQFDDYDPIRVIVAQNHTQGRFLQTAYPDMLDDAWIVTSEAEATGLRCTQLFVCEGGLDWPATEVLTRSMSMAKTANMFPIELKVPKYYEEIRYDK